MTSSPAQVPEPARPRAAHQTGATGVTGVTGTDEVADSVRAAVLALPGVADLHTGAFGEVATYLPGRRVEGVRVRADRTEVHVVVEWGASALEVADAVRAAATAITHTVVDVHVQDFAAPKSTEPVDSERTSTEQIDTEPQHTGPDDDVANGGATRVSSSDTSEVAPTQDGRG